MKALLFDVFGTVVDWKGSIIKETRSFASDWSEERLERFAIEWMSAYGRSMRSAREQWTPLDEILEDAYSVLALHFKLPGNCTLKSAWSRLTPWPDAVEGFRLLEPYFQLVAFTNANYAMLCRLAQCSGLPWTSLISAEAVKAYKPSPSFYQYALQTLKLDASQVILVASHTFDLNAAKRHGMGTALIERPDEPGSHRFGLDHNPDFVGPTIESFASWKLVSVLR